MEMIIGKSIIVFLSIAGFAISLYIRKEKGKESMVCLIGHDCHRVINSRYNKFFGIPNEIIGMVYYGLIGIIYSISLSNPIFQLPYLTSIAGIIITISAIASVYLVIIQAFMLKEFCTWCLASAAISIVIFIIFIF